MFGDSVSFEVDGNGTYNTFIGTIVSIAILFLVIPYGLRKYNIMIQFNDTNFAESVVSRPLLSSSTESLSFDDIELALGIVMINKYSVGVLATDEFKDHLQVVANYVTWNYNTETVEFGISSDILPLHPCTEDDFKNQGFAKPNED